MTEQKNSQCAMAIIIEAMNKDYQALALNMTLANANTAVLLIDMEEKAQKDWNDKLNADIPKKGKKFSQKQMDKFQVDSTNCTAAMSQFDTVVQQAQQVTVQNSTNSRNITQSLADVLTLMNTAIQLQGAMIG